MKGQTFFCEACGAPVPRSAPRCPACGREFDAVRCPRCGYTGDPAEFKQSCPDCGYRPEASHEPGTARAPSRRSRGALSRRAYRRLLLLLSLLLAGALLLLWIRLAASS